MNAVTSPASPPFGLVGRLVRSRLALPTGGGWRFAHGMLERPSSDRPRDRALARAQRGRRPDAAASRGTPGRIARRGRHLLGRSAPTRPSAPCSRPRGAACRRTRRCGLTISSPSPGWPSSKPTLPSDGRWAWRLLTGRVLKARQELDDAWRTATGVRRMRSSSDGDGWRPRPSRTKPTSHACGRPARAPSPVSSCLCYQISTTPGARRHPAQPVFGGHPARRRPRGLLTDARRCYDDLGDRFGAAMCLAGLGDIARVRQNWEEATWFRSSLGILRSLGHRSGVALGLHGLAEVQRLTGNLEAARDGYLQVIQLDDAGPRQQASPFEPRLV